MKPTPDDLQFVVAPHRSVPDEFDSDGATRLAPDRAMPEYVMSHVRQYALRLFEARNAQSD